MSTAERKEEKQGDINLVATKDKNSKEGSYREWVLMEEADAKKDKGKIILQRERIESHEMAFFLVKQWLGAEFIRREGSKIFTWRPYWGTEFTPHMRTLGRVLGEELFCEGEVRGHYRIDCDLYPDQENDPAKQKGPHFNVLVCIEGPKKELEKYAFKYLDFAKANAVRNGKYAGMRQGAFDALQWQIMKTKAVIKDRGIGAYVETMPIEVAKEFLQIYQFSKDQPGDTTEVTAQRKKYQEYFSSYFSQQLLTGLIAITESLAAIEKEKSTSIEAAPAAPKAPPAKKGEIKASAAPTASAKSAPERKGKTEAAEASSAPTADQVDAARSPGISRTLGQLGVFPAPKEEGAKSEATAKKAPVAKKGKGK